MCRLAEKGWEAIWITAEDISEEGLLLSKHMLLDHLPDRTVVAINSAEGRLPEGGLPQNQPPVPSFMDPLSDVAEDREKNMLHEIQIEPDDIVESPLESARPSDRHMHRSRHR